MGNIDWVRANTADVINRRIDRAIESRAHDYSIRGRDAITRHMEELDRERNIERVLETNATTVITFTGLTLGVRTRSEIDRETYAFKVLRGDFDVAKSGERADVALQAVSP